MDWSLSSSGCTIYTAQQYRPWYNYLSNGSYGLKISHLGDGYATTLKEPRIAVSNYDFFYPIKGRYVYVKDADTVWNPSFMPSETELDSYSCTHRAGVTSWKSEKNNIAVTQKIFLPLQSAHPDLDTYEIWTVSVTNNRKEKASISLFPEMEFLLYNSFSVDPVYYSWYSDTQVDENGSILFERRTAGLVTGFFAPLEKSDFLEASLKRFLDGKTPREPGAIRNGKLSGSMSSGDPYIGAFQYDITLEAGETKQYAFFAGIGKNTLSHIRSIYHTYADVENECCAVQAQWKEKLSLPLLRSVELPKAEAQVQDAFSSWLNTFFGYQIYQQSTGLVRGTYRGFRDVAQDAMGIVMYDKKIARDLLIDMCTRQYKSGRCLRQWNTEGGSNDERDFRDLPFWIIAALFTYERYTNDASIYSEKAVWLDDKTESTLWEHAVRGIEYALRIGDHGLVKMGIGDWNDALSGIGLEGGSVFLNEFAYWALGLVEKAAAQNHLAHPFQIADMQNKLYEGVMKYWNGKWFARAFTDEGILIGGTERIFQLPQSWFTISGMAERNPEVAKKALDSMLSQLERPEGLLKMMPGYEFFEKSVGNLSALAPGMAENFAIYNHAAAFAVYALFSASRSDDALRIMQKILPFTKDWKVTKAEPYVLVNFYNGGFRKEKAGEGGVPWLTGTVNWLALSIFDFMVQK